MKPSQKKLIKTKKTKLERRKVRQRQRDQTLDEAIKKEKQTSLNLLHKAIEAQRLNKAS
jgi:hypothetical protein